MNLLLVDDEIEQKESWEETLNTIEKTNKERYSIDLSFSKDIETAKDLIANKNIDFLIVDLRLGKSDPEGNSLINMVYELSLRIPTIVVTGTPEDVLDDTKIIRKFKKDETSISEIINYLISIYNTGINEIVGKTGLIESAIMTVYQKGLMPTLSKWGSYGMENSENTKKALLRYTINYLYELLDEETEKYYPEEVYIRNLDNEKLSTGSIFTKNNQDYFIVLSPACDLAIRKNGDYKTDSILLVSIEETGEIVNPTLEEIKNITKKNDRLKKFYTNTETLYYHWLPCTSLFKGGIINFRKVTSIPKESLLDYSSCNIKISPYFLKDIISRFSSYYARQGQPDIYNDEFLLRDEKDDE